MKKEDLAKLTDSQKLNYLIEKIEKLDRTINPPWWKRGLHWALNHWVIVLALVGILWGMWQMWDELQMLLTFVTQINDSVENLRSGVSKFTNGAGSVTETVTDTVKETFKGWKFWE